MTCCHLHSVLLGTVRCCFCWTPREEGITQRHGQELLGTILAWVCQSWKNLPGGVRKTSHYKWTLWWDVWYFPCGWKIDWENSFSDVWESEESWIGRTKVRSQRVSLHELRSIPKGWVSHQEVPWSEIHGIHVILAARQQVGGTGDRGNTWDDILMSHSSTQV